MTQGRFTEVTILLRDDALERMGEVLRDLQRAGLQSPTVQQALGTITGRIADDAVEEIEGLPWVAAIERSRTITLPDPGSDVQ